MAKSYALMVSRSRIRVRTYAKGLLSALAHDLELEVVPSRGSAGPLPNGSWSALIDVAIDDLRVNGAIKRGKLDHSALSPSDMAEILRRMRADVFSGEKRMMVEAVGTLDRYKVEVTIGTRRPVEIAAKIAVTDRGAEVEVRASGTASLRALGSPEIKGPMGAFALKDEIELEVELILRDGSVP